MTTANDTVQRRLIKASQWNRYHAWPPPGGLRSLIFNAEKNGFKSAVRKVGRSVLIDETAFFQWVDSHQNIEPT